MDMFRDLQTRPYKEQAQFVLNAVWLDLKSIRLSAFGTVAPKWSLWMRKTVHLGPNWKS